MSLAHGKSACVLTWRFQASAPVEPSTADTSKKDGQQPQASTSTAAFAASGFSKLASASASPFASAGTGKSVFGGGATGSASPFASLGSSSPSKSVTPPTIPKPTLSFGSKDASAPSPFAAVNGATPSAFGGGGFGGGGFGSSSGSFGGGNFGGGSAFGTALSGSRTGNFASPGVPPIIKSDKPAKPFGAPESDVEEESDEGSDNDGDEGRGSAVDGEKEEKDDVASRDASTPAGGDDEKKAKYKKGMFPGLQPPRRQLTDVLQWLSMMARPARQQSSRCAHACTTSTSQPTPMARRKSLGASAVQACSRSTCL